MSEILIQHVEERSKRFHTAVEIDDQRVTFQDNRWKSAPLASRVFRAYKFSVEPGTHAVSIYKIKDDKLDVPLGRATVTVDVPPDAKVPLTYRGGLWRSPWRPNGTGTLKPGRLRKASGTSKPRRSRNR